MREVRGNIWDYEGQGYIVIPTNGFVKTNGECVMGRGLAFQAAKKYPLIPSELGRLIKLEGNHVHHIGIKMLSFPVKHVWWEKADPKLILQSVDELKEIGSLLLTRERFFLPRVGCGNGQLDWFMVKPLLNLLNDRFTVVDRIGD